MIHVPVLTLAAPYAPVKPMSAALVKYAVAGSLVNPGDGGHVFHPLSRRRRPGVGDLNPSGVIKAGTGAAGSVVKASGSTQQLILSAPSIAGSVLTAGGTVSTATGSTSIAAAAWGPIAIPIIGAAVAGVTIALMLYFGRKGPKQKVATTEIVDKIEPLLQQNVDGYLAGPRNLESQQQAIQNFRAGWQYVIDGCDIPEMGTPGKNCVSERQRGGKWDWFRLYLDPIANDTLPAEKAASGEDSILNTIFGGGSSTSGGAAGGVGGLLILAALFALLVML